MNVPACPIPIHQTKLMMAYAQATGMLLPQTPMPVATVYATAPASTSVPAPEIPNSTHHTRDGVHAGASSRSVSCAGPLLTAVATGQLRVGVGDGGEILD